MMKKSLFFGTAARSIAPAIASLLVLFAFVGCSNPSSGTTEYVAQLVGDEFEYPAGTVFAETFEELLGVLNDTLEVTNGVTYVAYNGGVSTFSQDLIIPAGKIVYLNAYDTSDTIADGFDDDNGQLSDNIIVEPGATLVLVTNLKTDGAGNQLLVKGLVEVYGALIIGTNALDVADYHEQANGTFEAVNTVIGKNVAVKAGGILALRGIDIKLANDSSHDRFTPAEAWAYTGQGSLEITDVKDSNYSVAYLLTGVSPSASRYYSVTTNGGGDLPPLIPQGAYITANGTITDTTDHNLTVNGELRADATTATFKNIVNLTVNGVLQANNASFESVENLIISSVNTENVSRASIAPYKPRGGWLGADKATLKKAKNINIGDNGVFESESTAIDLPADTEIVLGKSAAFNASGATLNTFAEVVRIFIGPASQVVLGSTDVSLESLKSLTVKDGGFLVSPGTFTFKLDQPAVQGKNALIAGKYKADAEVDLVFNGDTTLVNFSGIISGGISEYVITEKSTLAIADGATVTVPSGVTLNLSALKLPTTAAPDAPVKISGTIQVAAGGKVIGPNIAGLTDTDKAALFTTFDFGS
ncbi:MAG: hypothetical protein LBB78_12350, partial [Spirochaetaceae bacterium]|nr:hypothetical protein [Spirochaetaceae bacterium]